MQHTELKSWLYDLVTAKVPLYDIADVEETCGTLWITDKDGDVYAVTVMKTEPAEDGE